MDPYCTRAYLSTRRLKYTRVYSENLQEFSYSLPLLVSSPSESRKAVPCRGACSALDGPDALETFPPPLRLAASGDAGGTKGRGAGGELCPAPPPCGGCASPETSAESGGDSAPLELDGAASFFAAVAAAGAAAAIFFAATATLGPVPGSGETTLIAAAATVATVAGVKQSSKMLGGASQIVSMIRVKCNGT
jgi:hypothetical protein